jgi:hypothetical protein
MSAEEKTDKILIGSSGFVQLGSADELKSYSGPAAFCSASPEQWKVRSGNYMNDKAKVNSEGPALLKIAGADLFKSPKKMTHIMQRLAAPEGFLPELQRSGEFYCPRLIVVNCMLPLYSHSIMGSKDDGESAQFVLYFVVDQDAYDKMSSSSAPAPYKLLRSWLQADPTHEKDYQNRGKLKAIPEIMNLKEINLGMVLRKLVEANSAKPFLTGPKFHSFVKKDDYLEVDVDIHRYTYMARDTLSGLLPEIPKMMIRFGMVVEGRATNELPEQLLGGILMKVDPRKAKLI